MYTKILLCCLVSTSLGNLQDDISKTMQDRSVSPLSRKRRYLAFPEGSSFQMVYDLTYPSVALMGDLFLFGNTAVMAWKLPNEPIFLDKNRLEEAKNDSKMMENVEKLKFDYENIQHADTIHDWDVPVNYEYSNSEEQPYVKWRKVGNYDDYYGQDYFYPTSRYEHFQSPQLYHHIHRRSRRDLYKKIEKLFSAFKEDGNACILKAICQFTQFSDKKGSLVVEILKAVFKTRPYENYLWQDKYDSAARPNLNCEQLFSKCKGSILNHIFANKKRK